MPSFTVRTPSGRTYTVNAPEGATQQDAIDYVMDTYPDFDPKEGQHLAVTGQGTASNPFGSDTSSYGGDDSLDDIWDSAPVGSYVRRKGGGVERKDATLVENLVGSAARGWNRLKDVPEALGEFVDVGVAKGREALEEAGILTRDVGGPAGALARTVSPVTAQTRAEARDADVAQAAGTARRGREQAEYADSIDHLKPESVRALDRARTAGEAWDAIKAHPIDTIGSIGVESGVQFLPAIAASFLPGGAALASATAGGMSAATELASGLESFVADNGINPKDEAAVRAFLLEGDNLEKAREYALTRAGIIGAIDATTGGVGKLATIGKDVVKSAAVREAANIAGQTGIEMGLGAGGEALAQGVTKGFDNISGKDVLLEAAGEMVQTPGEVAGYARERYRDATRPGAPITGTDSGAIAVAPLPDPGSQRPSGPGTVPKPRMTVAQFEAEVARRAAERAAEVEAGALPAGAAAVEDVLDQARATRGVTLSGEQRVQEATQAASQRASAVAEAKTETPAVATPAAPVAQSTTERIERDATSMLDAAAAQALTPPAMPLAAAPVQAPAAPAMPNEVATAAPAQQVGAPAAAASSSAPPAAAAPTPPIVAPAAPEANAVPTAAGIQRATTQLPEYAPPAPPAPRLKIADQGAQARDGAVVAGVLNRYAKAGEAPLAPEQVRVVQLEDPKAQRTADRLSRVLGRRVVFYDAPTDSLADAFAVDGKNIYISARAINSGKYSPRALIGHEFVHTLRMGNRELFNELAAFAVPLINRNSAGFKKTAGLYASAYTNKSGAELDAAIDEEVIADRIGDLLDDDAFWAQLAGENPSLFERTIRDIIRFLDKLLGRAKTLQADDVFNDAQAMRAKALDILKRHAAQVAAGEQTVGEKGDARLKIGAPSGDVTVDGKSMFDEMNGAEEGSPRYHVARALLYFDGDIDAAVDGVERYARAEGVVDPYILSELKADLEDMQANAPEIAGGVESIDYDEIADLFKKRASAAESRPRLDAATAIANFDTAYSKVGRPGTSQAEQTRLKGVLRAAMKDMENATGATAEQLRAMSERAGAGLLEVGEYTSAARTSQAAATGGKPPPKDIDSPELRSFMADGGKNAKSGGKARVYVHGTATNPTQFRAKQGDAVFMTGTPDFAAPYAGSSRSYVERNGQASIILDGKPLSAIIDSDRLFETPLWHAAQLLSIHDGNVDQAIENADLLQDYAGNELSNEEVLDTLAELDRIKAKAEADPNYLKVEQMDSSQIGMSMMPLITNVKNTWDFHSYKHVDQLMKALREKYGSPERVSAAMTGNNRQYFESWYEIQQKFASEGDWTLIEDAGVGIPAMLKEMGFDSYHVMEEGVKNLAVFDPKRIKSAYGNVGTWGQRAPTAEEAASLGMTLEEAIAAQELGDIRLKASDKSDPRLAISIRGMQNGLANLWQGIKDSEGWATFHRWMTDEFVDLKKIQDYIATNVFGSLVGLPNDLNVWRKENLRHGSYQDQRRAALKKFVEPMTRLLAKNGHTLDQFSDYLWWRHATERDEYMRARLAQGVQVGPDGLAGISPADAQAAIAALDPATRKTFEAAARFVDAMRKDTLDRMLNTGQITPERHSGLLNQYQFYVPLRGMPGGDVDPMTGRARGLSMSQNPLGKRAKGRQSKAGNIIEHMVTDMEQSMINGLKQGVLSSLVRLIAANPDPALWEVAPVKAERKWVDGQLTIVQTNGEPKDQLTFMHNGIPVAIEIRHDGLREALLNMNADNVPKILRSIGRVTRWLSAVKTSFSPYFLLINPLRDGGLASMALLAEHDMKAVVDFGRFYTRSYAALSLDDRAGGRAAARIAAKKGDQTLIRAVQYAREFSAFGGKTGYTYVNDIRQQQKGLDALMTKHAKSPGMADLLAGNHRTKDAALLGKKLMQSVANLFELTNDLAENATRLAVFSAMRERGMTPEEAAAYAKEVTVNFNRRGAVGKHLNTLYMFFNAAMQGSARLVRLSKNPKFAGMMGGLAALSYVSALGQMIGAGDDDDGESRFQRAVGKDGERSIPIYVGNGNTITLPVPYGPNMMTHLGYRLAKATYDEMRGKTDAWDGVAGDIAAHMVTSMSPIDPGKGATAFMPEVVRVPLQAATNRNDFGGRISPKLDDRDQTNPARYTETDPKTMSIARWVAQGLNALSGGNAYEGGAINLTGEQAEYVGKQLGGGLGRLAIESSDLVNNWLAGVDIEPSDVPLSNVYFRGKDPSGQTANAYYDKIDVFNKQTRIWEQAVAAGDQAKIDKMLRDTPWVAGTELSASTTEGREAQAGTLAETEREVRRKVKSLRQQKDALYEDDSISGADRRRRAQELDQLIAAEQSKFVGHYNYETTRR